jgi:predicted TPR repeat methyltransferase
MIAAIDVHYAADSLSGRPPDRVAGLSMKDAQVRTVLDVGTGTGLFAPRGVSHA